MPRALRAALCCSCRCSGNAGPTSSLVQYLLAACAAPLRLVSLFSTNMGRRSGRQQQPHQLSLLPLDVAGLVLSHLSRFDRCSLALSCSTGRQWVQAGRHSFRVWLQSQADVQAASSVLAKAPALRSCRLLYRGAGMLSLSLRSLAPALPQLQEVALEDITISRRTLFYLCQLPRLECLSLASTSSSPQHRINGPNEGGCLRELARCPTLRSLTVVNLGSDSGLDALTQLTRLSLTLPDHAPHLDELPYSAFDGYICENCGELHPEERSEMLRDFTKWSDRVTVGPALGALGGLRSLTVNLQGEGDQINVELNSLQLSSCTGLTSLTSLTLLNISRANHTGALLGAFNHLPALSRLEVQFEGAAYWLHWPAVGLKDQAGRPVLVTGRTACRWELERLPELAGVEE